jgi:DNA mismatch repair protein MutS
MEASVTTTTMLFSSILFDGTTGTDQRADPSVFSDLNLDQVFAKVAAGCDEYDLMPFFSVPLHDVGAVDYRQQIMRDMEDEALSAALAEFAVQMRDMRNHLAQSTELRHRYQKESWFLGAAGIYREAISALAEALTGITLSSRGFSSFREYITSYARSSAFTDLAADFGKVASDLASVRYCINIKGNRVTVTRYEDEADYGAEVQRTFAKFAEHAVKDYRVGFHSPPEMNHVEERILDRVARLYPDVFAALDEFRVRHAAYLDETIRVFDREVQFYTAYLAFIAPMRRAGLEFCYPGISAHVKEISASDSFDLALAAKLMPEAAAVVRNDFYLTGPERIFVVTGPNQGGKTTFARAFGQLHYLASLGCPVPARDAVLLLPDRVFTHFEREEDLATLRGKFEDELVRIHDVLERATGDSVVVMNESFASTTLRDALFVGERVLERLTGLGLLGVYVTFVDELASLNEACVSMVAEVRSDDLAERTFKVVRKPADGLAYAAVIAGKYRLTYRQLTERLAS